MNRIALLIIVLFSFSMISLADNARFDALRDAKREVPLLIGGYYMTGGTTGGTLSYSVFVPGVVVGVSTHYYPISPRSDRLLGKSPASVSAYVDAYESEVKSLRRRSLLWGFGAGVGLLIVLKFDGSSIIFCV